MAGYSRQSLSGIPPTLKGLAMSNSESRVVFVESLSSLASKDAQFAAWCFAHLKMGKDHIECVFRQHFAELEAYNAFYARTGMGDEPFTEAFQDVIPVSVGGESPYYETVHIGRGQFLALCDWFIRASGTLPEYAAKYLPQVIQPVLFSKLRKYMHKHRRNVRPEDVENSVSFVQNLIFGACANDGELALFVVPNEIQETRKGDSYIVTINGNVKCKCSLDKLVLLKQACHFGQWVLVHRDNHGKARLSANPRLNVVRAACNYAASHFIEMEIGRRPPTFKSAITGKTQIVSFASLDDVAELSTPIVEPCPVAKFMAGNAAKFHKAVLFAEMNATNMEDRLAMFAEYYGETITEWTYRTHRPEAMQAYRDSLAD